MPHIPNDVVLPVQFRQVSPGYHVTECNVMKRSRWIDGEHVMLFSSGSADSEMNDDQKKEKISELKKKEKDIQDILTQKMKELKKICLREAVKRHSPFI